MQKLVVVVTGQQTQETLERWVFDVHTDKSVGPEGKVEKSQKEITSEIQAIIRQITASVTFLPLLDEPCTFDLLVYTDNDVDVPQALHISSGELLRQTVRRRLHPAWLQSETFMRDGEPVPDPIVCECLVRRHRLDS